MNKALTFDFWPNLVVIKFAFFAFWISLNASGEIGILWELKVHLNKSYALFLFFFFTIFDHVRLVNMVLDKYKAYNPEPSSYSTKYAASHFLSI